MNEKINIEKQFGGKVRELTEEEMKFVILEIGGIAHYWIILMEDGKMFNENCDWNANERCVRDGMVAIGYMEDYRYLLDEEMLEKISEYDRSNPDRPSRVRPLGW